MRELAVPFLEKSIAAKFGVGRLQPRYRNPLSAEPGLCYGNEQSFHTGYFVRRVMESLIDQFPARKPQLGEVARPEALASPTGERRATSDLAARIRR